MTNIISNENRLINDLLANGKQGRTWGELALIYNIKSHGDPEQRKKKLLMIWRKHLKKPNNLKWPHSEAKVYLKDYSTI